MMDDKQWESGALQDSEEAKAFKKVQLKVVRASAMHFQ